jgi:hypothetical protein
LTGFFIGQKRDQPQVDAIVGHGGGNADQVLKMRQQGDAVGSELQGYQLVDGQCAAGAGGDRYHRPERGFKKRFHWPALSVGLALMAGNTF